MEVSHHRAAHGGCTRDRSLAPSATVDSSLAYLELRSRRLSKLPLPSADSREISTKSHRSKATSLERANRSLRKGSESITASDKREEAGEATEAEVDAVPDLEVSFAENIHSVQDTERSSRIIRTQGSTARPTTSALHTVCQRFPTQQDMDEFFANIEQHHQRNLKEKYNFDFVNENPLPGRYEWVRPDCF
ncbi:cyclin-dependent kinase inhibitor 5-like [Zingiber officinale]|uniref:cyclin-dependent kinase inhibitor 5-like n=1 Tax=Zingiber officinale TaxID=94328 RepID=UPI001C4A8FE4|nr:cyclin-dependent kinase inhibitor 5-like [Zingiber officinale]